MFIKSGHKKKVRESFLCAGYDKGEKDSCEVSFITTYSRMVVALKLILFLKGDSGGPLMVEQPDGRWVLAGTVSHGIKCAYPDMPGVYMRMTYYKPWIEKITGIKL